MSRYMSADAQQLGKQLSLNCLMFLVRDNKGFAISIFLDSWCINIQNCQPVSMVETDNSKFSLQATLHTVTKNVILDSDHILLLNQMAQVSPFHTKPCIIQGPASSKEMGHSMLPTHFLTIPLHCPLHQHTGPSILLALAHTLPLHVLCTSIFSCPAGKCDLTFLYFHYTV